MDSIKFYEGPYYMFSNFSAHRVVYNGEEYMTSEHAYQAAKFSDPEMKKRVKEAPSAFAAWKLGQSDSGRYPDFDKVSTMTDIMRAKMQQHEDVRLALLATGDAHLEKNHPLDAFWGTGDDGKGRNVMGMIWMDLRKEIIG